MRLRLLILSFLILEVRVPSIQKKPPGVLINKLTLPLKRGNLLTLIGPSKERRCRCLVGGGSREVPVENTSFDFRGDLSWIRMDDEVGSSLLKSIREDQQPYDWAEAQLRQAFSALDEALETAEAGKKELP